MDYTTTPTSGIQQSSVIIPAYNEQSYLKSCVKSIATQQGAIDHDIEILICNDASTDDTGLLADRLADTMPTVTALHNETNQGILQTTKRLVDAADGDIILRIDADSELRSGSLRALAQAFEQDTDLLYGKVHVSNTKYLHPAASQHGKETGAAAWYGAACVAVRADKLTEISIASLRQNIELELMNRAKQENWTVTKTESVAIDSAFPVRISEWLPRKHDSGRVYIRESADTPEQLSLSELRGPIAWTGIASMLVLSPIVSLLLTVAVLGVYLRSAPSVVNLSGKRHHAITYPVYMAIGGIARTVGVYSELPLLLRTVVNKYA